MSTETKRPLAAQAGSALEWRVHTSRLLEEIAKHSGQSVLVQPLRILGSLLAKVGERASQLHDRELDALMMRLTIYTVADPESPDYDPTLVSEYLKPNSGMSDSQSQYPVGSAPPKTEESQSAS